jgi:seryl-tRNA synthetase
MRAMEYPRALESGTRFLKATGVGVLLNAPLARGMTAKDLGMHDIKWIHEHPDAFDRGLARRGLKGEAQYLISLDDRRRAQIRVSESFKARRNKASKEIAEAKAKNDKATVEKLMAEVAECKTSISTLEAEEKEVSEELNEALKWIPNLPLDEVPDGQDANDNVEHHRFGAKRNYGFTPQEHSDLGEALGQMDFKTAAKLSGARFVVLKAGLARLERALAQFMLDLHTTEHGYTEVSPPLLVRDEVMFGTGQLPKFIPDQFFNTEAPKLETFDTRGLADAQAALMEIQKKKQEIQDKLDAGAPGEDPNFLRRELIAKSLQEERQKQLIWSLRPTGLWLIPTAEVPLTNLVRESILEQDALPMRFTAGTPCFRAEAGAAGKDTHGMIRQHQFEKVELVSITAPEESKDEHERMLACAEEVLRRLDLHYRVITLCTGDMGFAAQKTYDIEVWLPGQDMYREISSCSLCGEFQARRMNARYRAKDGRQVRYVHTLNGSGVAIGRALIAVMETYQQQGGSIAVPDVLQSYMGGLKTIERAG